MQPPLTMVCIVLHLELEGYPVEEGAMIEIPLLPWGQSGRPAAEHRADSSEVLCNPSSIDSMRLVQRKDDPEQPFARLSSRQSGW